MTQPTEHYSISVRAECSLSRIPLASRPLQARVDDNYQVTVQASDGNKIGYFEVTVQRNQRGRNREGNLDRHSP